VEHQPWLAFGRAQFLPPQAVAVFHIQVLPGLSGTRVFTGISVHAVWHSYCLTFYKLMPVACQLTTHQLRRPTMQWTTPSFTDLRFGFEITMYIANR
jgi:pyrroloquinoline quinone biosynthesis protein A